MNKIINKFLLTEDKFVPELHLKQLGFIDSACRPFTKHCERIQKFRETGNKTFIQKSIRQSLFCSWCSMFW